MTEWEILALGIAIGFGQSALLYSLLAFIRHIKNAAVSKPEGD